MPNDPASALASIPPGVDPADWLEAMREQQLAQLALSSATTPTQPQNWGRAASRESILSPISKVAQALMARRALDRSTTLEARTYAQALRAFNGGSDSKNSNAPSDGPPNSDIANSGGTVSQTASGKLSPPAVNAANSQPISEADAATGASDMMNHLYGSNPLNPTGAPAPLAMRAYQQNPMEYLKSIMGTPAWQDALRATHGDQNAAAQLMLAKATKEGTITARQGEAAYLPNGQVIRNPLLSAGEVPVYDSSGNLTGTRLLPGHAEAQGAITGSETAAREANTPREVPMGGGVERLTYPGDVPSVGLPPALRSQASSLLPIMDENGQIISYRQRAAGASSPAPGSSLSQPSATRTSPTAAARAPSSGAQQRDAWANVPRLPMPSTPGQSTDAFHQKILEQAASKHVELQNKLADDASLADQKQQYNAQAIKALPNAEVGPLSDWLTTNRARLLEAGIPASLIPEAGTVTPTLELNKYLKNTALQGARQIYGSRMTQTEVKLQTDEMSPSAHMTRDAIASLIAQDQIRNSYAKQRAQDYQRYFGQGGDPLQFESWYARNRPLTRFAAQSQTPSAALDRLKQRPETLGDFKARYGWDPTQ